MGLSWLLAVALPPWLTLFSDGAPMRLGLSVPSAVLSEGLGLAGNGVVQWRPLPLESPDPERIWVEVGIVAPRGRVRLVVGGDGPALDGCGKAFALACSERQLAQGVQSVRRWRWADGTIDEARRTVFADRTTFDGETYAAGEALTVRSPSLSLRARWWCAKGRRLAERTGLLPGRGRSVVGRRLRDRLLACVPRLVEMRGRRGAGDFRRLGGEVTNLEFDTTFALLRTAVAMADESAFEKAQRAAIHLRDRDLDPHTGLPFVHGAEHRANAPEPGHVWLQGLLWVGLTTGDRELVLAARSLARSLSRMLPMGTGSSERLRDYAWPLMEIEAMLAVHADPILAQAAGRLVASIRSRFDAAAATFRFGEGKVGDAVYLERGWLTGGLLVPALRRHLARVPDRVLSRQLEDVVRALRERIGSGGAGLPTHWRIVGGRVVGVHYERDTARASWILEALPPRQLGRLLQRSSVRRAIADVPDLDDANLPTEFTMLARCDFVWR